MASNVTPSISRRPVVIHSYLVSFPQSLQSCRRGRRYSPQKRQNGSAFAQHIGSFSQVLQTDGHFCHLTLTSRFVRAITNGRDSSLCGHLLRFPRYYRPSPSPLSPATDFPGSPVMRFPAKIHFATGQESFSSYFSMTLSPCYPYQPRQSVSPYQFPTTLHAAFMARKSEDSAFPELQCAVLPEAIWVHLRYGPATHHHPVRKWLHLNRLQNEKFPPLPCYSSYRELDFLPRWDFHPLFLHQPSLDAHFRVVIRGPVKVACQAVNQVVIVAVGTVITDRPPHRSVTCASTHTALLKDGWRGSDPNSRSISRTPPNAGTCNASLLRVRNMCA